MEGEIIGALSAVLVALLGREGLRWRSARNGRASHNPGNPGPMGHHDCQAAELAPALQRIEQTLGDLTTAVAVLTQIIKDRLPQGGGTL